MTQERMTGGEELMELNKSGIIGQSTSLAEVFKVK
ncbi:protein of unknown function [Desulfovibrio sp. 86]|nr:protein of unknown function [Desulfovibrio sp. 86]